MEKTNVRIEVADPTPLGLFGLALVTLVASSQKMGLTDGVGILLPWAVLLGGVAQIIASMFDFKHCNLFGATAFGAYGLFWVGMGTSWLITLGVFGETLQAAADTRQLGFVFVGYLLFTIPLTISGLKISKAMFVLLCFICVLFISLALGAFGCGKIWGTIAAYTELIISLLTFYMLSAKYLNDFFGKQMLSVGKPFIK